MDEVCVGPDVELSNRKTPPEHCSVTRQNREGSTVLKLEIKRVRKEGNETLKTLSDFRKYVCKVRKDNQDGSATVELVGKCILVHCLKLYQKLVYETRIRKRILGNIYRFCSSYLLYNYNRLIHILESGYMQ